MAVQNAYSRVAVWPEDVPRSPIPQSPVIKAGGFVFVSGQSATDYVTGLASDVGFDPRAPYVGSRLELETRYVFKNLERSLAAAGCDLRTDVIRNAVWVTSPHPTYDEFLQGESTTGVQINDYARALYDVMDEPRGASSGVGVRRLPARGTTVMLDTIAIEPAAGNAPQGFELPDGVPKPVLKYSPAIRRGDWIWLAGDLATDFVGDDESALAPEARISANFWYGDSIEAQTDYLLSKLEKIAAGAGSSLDRCVRAEIFMGHPQDRAGIDRAWARRFPDYSPARSIVPYSGLAGRGCRVEMSLLLLANDSSLSIDTIETSDAPEPFGPEPQAVRAGDMVFLSSQLPVDSHGRVPVDLLPDSEFPYFRQPAKRQMHYMAGNIAAICEAAGSSLEQLCRRQAFYADLGDLAQSSEEWLSHFPNDPPAETAVEIGGPIYAPGVHAVLDVIGYAGD